MHFSEYCQNIIIILKENDATFKSMFVLASPVSLPRSTDRQTAGTAEKKGAVDSVHPWPGTTMNNDETDDLQYYLLVNF